MKKSETVTARMICETPSVLVELGMDADFGRVIAERFSSIRLTERTQNAICSAVCDIRSFSAPEDEPLLSEILRLVIDEDKAERTAARLIFEFGSLLGVLTAAQKSSRRLGIGAGECARVELLASIYLRKARRVKIVDREQAELYLGTLLGLGEEKTAAVCLDGDFVVSGAVEFSEILPDAQSLSELLRSLGGKYILLARKTGSVGDGYFDLASAVNALPVRESVADYLLFTPQGNAHLLRKSGGERYFELLPIGE